MTPQEIITKYRLPNRGEDENYRGYVGWGPYEDALAKEGDWWDCRQVNETWAEFYEGMADADPDLNLIFDFYFDVSHAAKDCTACDRSGYNPETKQIADDFYDFNQTGRRWCNTITQDEVQALVDKGRLMDFTHTWSPETRWERREDGYVPTAAEVNKWNSGTAMGHDAINRWILIEARARRLGVWGHCSACDGEGTIRLSDDRLELNLWIGYPRKGASRGIHIKSVRETELSQVQSWLMRSWRQHQSHFVWVTGDTPDAGEIAKSAA